MEGVTGQQLFRVVAATRLSDQRIAVVNAGTSEIRFFSPAGEFLASSGGEGEGPQEFRLIRGAARGGGDTLVIYTRSEIAWVSSDGQVVRKTPVNRAGLRFDCHYVERGINVRPDGSLLVQAEEQHGSQACTRHPDGLHRHTELVAIVPLGSDRADTIAIVQGTERVGLTYALAGRSSVVVHDGSRIFIGDTGSDTIRVFSTGGEQVSAWRLPIDEVPTPTESVRRYDIPTSYPRFARVLVDRVGNLWVMTYPSSGPLDYPWRFTSPEFAVADAAGADWVVLDNTGEQIATVHTPAGLFVLEVGEDYVLGVTRDEFDVEFVQLHALNKARSP